MRKHTISAVVAAMLSGTTLAHASPPAPMTGLAVKPPEGFIAKPIAHEGTYTTEYEVASRTDPDIGCEIGFQPTRRSGPVTQQQINAAASTPAFLDTVRSSLGPAYDHLVVQSFSMGGIDGVEAVGDVRASNGEARALLVIVETPRGRTNVSCAGPSARFDALRPSFEAVVRGVTPPR